MHLLVRLHSWTSERTFLYQWTDGLQAEAVKYLRGELSQHLGRQARSADSRVQNG